MRLYKPARMALRVLSIVLTLLLAVQSASTANYYQLSARALVTVTKPNVNLQAGNFGNSTIYVNSTSAMATTPTLNYPTGYNIITGTCTSGTTPGSVNAIDSNRFITSSTTTPDVSFKDGASVAVPTSIAAIDSIGTTLPAGNNIVVAAVQFDNTAAPAVTITAGNLELRRGTGTTDPLLSETQFDYSIDATGSTNDGNFAVLTGRDPGAPACPTYAILATGSAAGVNAEVKFIVVNGATASSFQDGNSVAIGTAETTLLSHASTVGAGDNVVITVVQLDRTSAGGTQTIAGGNFKLKRGASVLATNEFGVSLKNGVGEDLMFVVLIARDAGAPASPTYDVTAVHSATGVNGEAKILVLNGLDSAIVDTGSVAVGTTRTQIGQVTTTFPVGNDIIIGAFQFTNTGAARTLAAGSIEVNRVGGASSSNQFPDVLAAPPPDGTFHVIMRTGTTAAANPTYEGAVTAPATGINAELKLIAIHVKERIAETEFTFSVSSTSPIQLNFTVVQQYSIASVNVTIRVYNYTGAAYPTTGQGYLTYISSATASTDETKSLTITTNPQHYTSGGAVKVKIKGFSSASFDQKVNLVRLYYYQQTYDYVLKVVNQEATSYNIRLNSQGLTQSNIARLSNFTAWFHDGSPSSVQLQILSGNFSTQTGSPYSLGASATAYIAVRVTASSGVSTIDCYLQTYNLGGNSHTDYRLTFKIT